MSDMLIASYLDRRMSEADREQFENHLAECEDCRRAVIEARSLMKQVRPTWRMNTVVGVLAAALIFVVVDLKVQHRNDLAAPASTRAVQPVGSAITPYGPIGEVARAGLRFVWSPLANAISYRLSLVDANSQPVWSTAAADTSIALPPSVSLRVGENYFWSVDALASDGATRSTGLHEFHVIR